MTNIWQMKIILFVLLIICTTSMIFFIGNLSQLESVADRTLQPLVYRHLFSNDSNQILLTRMVYLDRQEHLQKMCHSYMQDFRHEINLTKHREMYDHILVDQKHRLLYCYVPKRNMSPPPSVSKSKPSKKPVRSK